MTSSSRTRASRRSWNGMAEPVDDARAPAQEQAIRLSMWPTCDALALDSTDPPAEHDGIYPRGALLAANYSVPILWLSLFDAAGLVSWPDIHGDSAHTAVVQPRSECIGRSRARLGEWSRRWPKCSGTCPSRG